MYQPGDCPVYIGGVNQKRKLLRFYSRGNSPPYGAVRDAWRNVMFTDTSRCGAKLSIAVTNVDQLTGDLTRAHLLGDVSTSNRSSSSRR